MFRSILVNTSPTDIWHDSFAQLIIAVIVALLVGMVTVIVAIWIFRNQRGRKEISYEVISDTPIASINQEVKDQVELRFQGKVVEDIQLVVLKIRNVGNLSIEKTDFVEPIKFEFARRKYLTGEVISCEPEEVINVKERTDFFKPGREEVTLAPILFNSTDEVSIKMLLTGQGKIKGTARIIGGKLTEIDLSSQPPTIKISKALAFFAPLVGGFFFILGFLVAWALLTYLLKQLLPIDPSLQISLLIIIFIWGFYRIYSNRKTISQKLSQIREKGIRIIW